MRSIDIDVSERVWIYRREHHKTEHKDKAREIYLGPKAQEVLRPWLRPELEAYLFSPVEAEEHRHHEQRSHRRSPMTPSQAKQRPKPNPKRVKRERYDARTYRQAIQRACDRAFPPPEPLAGQKDESNKQWRARLTNAQKAELVRWRTDHRWHPNPLRHLAATLLRKEFGIELARIVLGHSTAFTTEIYAEADRAQAMDVICRVGCLVADEYIASQENNVRGLGRSGRGKQAIPTPQADIIFLRCYSRPNCQVDDQHGRRII